MSDNPQDVSPPISPHEGGPSSSRTVRNDDGELPKAQPPYRVPGKRSNNPNPPREQRDVER